MLQGCKITAIFYKLVFSNVKLVLAKMAPVLLSANPLVIAIAIPKGKLTPIEQGIAIPAPCVFAGTGIVIKGTSVPTVGAVALLCSFKYLTVDVNPIATIEYKFPPEAFTTFALVVASDINL